VANPEIDLSFARYVAARKGEASARSREGAAYAYSGDIKVRAALDRIRPVTLAVTVLAVSVAVVAAVLIAVELTSSPPRSWRAHPCQLAATPHPTTT